MNKYEPSFNLNNDNHSIDHTNITAVTFNHITTVLDETVVAKSHTTKEAISNIHSSCITEAEYRMYEL